MVLTRRAMMVAGLAMAASRTSRADDRTPGRMGVVIHSFPVRGRLAERRLSDPITFLEYGRSIGAGGVQVAIGARDDAFADDLRARAEAASMYLEGIASPPRDEGDLGRFEAEVRTAKRAGASIVRTAMLSGRRYEAFDSAEKFRRFADQSARSLALAAPILARHGVRLAVENHKDWRADELVALLKQVGGDHVGACVDTGNSIALLEDPMEVVEALAPWAVSTHLKDMAVEEFAGGFRIAEVPLGAGVLDLPRMVRVLREARPEIRFTLEMITRDPLDVPCLGDRYWATFPDLPGRQLARALRFVRPTRRGPPCPACPPSRPGTNSRPRTTTSADASNSPAISWTSDAPRGRTRPGPDERRPPDDPR